jgi:hypothetical protein
MLDPDRLSTALFVAAFLMLAFAAIVGGGKPPRGV